MLYPITLTLSGIVSVSRLLFRNAFAYIVSKPVPQLIVSILLLLKAPSPIVVNELPSVNVLIWLPLNASVPIVSTALPIITFVNEFDWNLEFSIAVTPLPVFNVPVNPNPSNVALAKLVTLSAIVILERLAPP